MSKQSHKIFALAKQILKCKDNELSSFAQLAKELTEINFNNRRSLFNPIYISNVCDGDCLYCGYRKANSNAIRSTLTPEQTLQEALFLNNRGINNILFLAGEYKHDKYVEMLIQNISIVQEKVRPNWIGIEVASLKKEAYEKLIKLGVKCVTLFQETYDIKRYNDLHSSGIKSDFFYRLNTLHRAANVGIPEVGLGVLYGVGDWYYDTLAMIQHGLSLKEEFPKLKLRFSFPRLMKSECQDEKAISELIDERILYKIIVTLRNYFPDSSLVLTGRESVSFVDKIVDIVNVFGKAGSTSVGGYTLNPNGLEQFELMNDNGFSEFYQMFSSKYDIL